MLLPSVAYPLSENEESVFFNNSTAAALAGFRTSHIFTHLTDISKKQSVAKNHSQNTRPNATNGLFSLQKLLKCPQFCLINAHRWSDIQVQDTQYLGLPTHIHIHTYIHTYTARCKPVWGTLSRSCASKQ